MSKEIIINNALFELVQNNIDDLLDILNNTLYSINDDYIEELYSKRLPNFISDNKCLMLINKLCKEGKLDITINYLYDIFNTKDKSYCEYIKYIPNKAITDSEIIKILQYINRNTICNIDLYICTVYYLINNIHDSSENNKLIIYKMFNSFIILINNNDKRIVSSIH